MPAVRLLDPSRQNIYIYTGSAITVDILDQFVQSFRAGKLLPYYRSDPIPKPDTVDGLKTLVGQTHQSIHERDEEVLVLYYTQESYKTEKI